MPKNSDKKTFKLGNNIFDLIAGHISNLVSSKPEEYIKSNMFTDLNRYQRSSKERRILIANDFSIVKKDAETLDENKLQKKFESILEQPDLRKELFRNQAQTSVATWSQLSVRDSTDRSDFMYGNVEDCLYIYFTKDDNNNPIMRTRRFVGLNYSENLLKQQSLYLDHAGGIRVSSLEDFRYIKSTSLDVDRRLVDVFEEVDYIYKYRAIGDVIDILEMSLDENVIDERLSEFSKDNHDYVLQAYRDPQKKQVEDLHDFLDAIKKNDMVAYLAARLGVDTKKFDDLNSNSQQDDIKIEIKSGSNIKPINLKFTRHSGKWLPQFFIATTYNNPNEIVPIKTSWIDNDIKIIFPEIIVHDRRVTYNDNLVVSSCLANFSTQQDSEVVDELRSFNLKLDFVEKVVDDFITIFSQSGYNDLDNIYNQTKNILKIDVAELISNPYLFDDIQDLDRIRSVLQRLIDDVTPLLDHKRKSEIMLSIEDIRTLLDNLIIPAFDDSPEVQSSKYSYIMSKSWDYVTSKVLAQYKARKEISSFYDKSINRDNIFLYISRFFCFTALVLAFIPLIIPMQQILIIAIPIFCVAVALLCFKLGQKFTTRMELTEGLRHADVEMFSLGSDDFLQAEKNKSFDKISAKSDAEAALERDKRILSDLLGI